jgi:hypothetical protein
VRGKKAFWLLVPFVFIFLLLQWSCGGGSKRTQPDLCNCTPTEPASTDYRTAAKHVDLPQTAPIEISVTDILNFPLLNPQPAFDAPRTGRELNLYHVGNAFVQFARLVGSDCDVHVEISATADKNAPRVIVETPHMDSYCAARHNLAAQLNAHGVIVDDAGQEVDPALPADVLGLAFQDLPHKRGTPQVATIWELHPAIVTLK